MMKTSDQMSGNEYMQLIDIYAGATLTGMLSLSSQQEDFSEDDLHQACDTAFTVARIMISKRDDIVRQLMTRAA
ncbi:MAG: hypothetical protein V1746_00295 [bacterium]